MTRREPVSRILSILAVAVLLLISGICALGYGEVHAQGDTIGSFIGTITSSLKWDIKAHNAPVKLASLNVDPRTLRQERLMITPGGDMGGRGSSGGGHYR